MASAATEKNNGEIVMVQQTGYTALEITSVESVRTIHSALFFDSDHLVLLLFASNSGRSLFPVPPQQVSNQSKNKQA
jgi:hypothetical protein